MGYVGGVGGVGVGGYGGVGYGGVGCGGYGGIGTSVGAILVLFILLVIISRTFLY
ncbi:hypothetical protein ACI48J_05140 [Paenibacillus chitinolyticus]|uniref:hypothetical protein n=1 Tax=Paenibacillus chitinolyticus TaxID=79263 RepID=UPI002DC6C22B|nr:hypothetical protein [Paenibacillus chitinolyticus]